MPRGRPPKPVEEKRRQGNPGKRPLPDVVLVKGRPNEMVGLLPEGFEHPKSLDAVAIEAWDEIVPALYQANILDKIDRLALENICLTWSRLTQIRQVIARQGIAALGSTGQLVAHPLLSEERAYLKEFTRLSEQYALTPVARARLGVTLLQGKTMAQELDDGLGRSVLYELVDLESTAEEE